MYCALCKAELADHMEPETLRSKAAAEIGIFAHGRLGGVWACMEGRGGWVQEAMSRGESVHHGSHDSVCLSEP